MASIQHKADQLSFKGRGPLDAKSLKKTYDELLRVDTWTVDDTLTAYNGMIVSVYLDKVDNVLSDKNGIYYLFDPLVTSVTKKPNVTDAKNWHKIGENSDLGELIGRLEQLESDVSGIDGLISKTNALDVTVNGEDGLITKIENKADKTDLSSYYTVENADKKFATIEAVDESLDTKANQEEVNELQASLVETINKVDAKIGVSKTDEAPATGLFAKLEAVDDSIVKIVTATDANTAKLNGISGTVLQAIEDAVKNISVEVATEENLGGIKSSTGTNIVSVDDEGIASVKEINVNTLTQAEGDFLTLDGGTSGVGSI